MLTNNYIFRKNILFMNSTISSPPSETFVWSSGDSFMSTNASCMLDDIGGNIPYGRSGEVKYEMQTSASSCLAGVYFGSGTTPATRADYKLESPITSGLSISNTSIVTESDGNGQYSYLADYRIKNNSVADISISELGLFLPVGSSNTAYYPVLMERSVLETPVVIEPGKSKKITYKVTIHHPSVVG